MNRLSDAEKVEMMKKYVKIFFPIIAIIWLISLFFGVITFYKLSIAGWPVPPSLEPYFKNLVYSVLIGFVAMVILAVFRIMIEWKVFESYSKYTKK
jgi:uncharacterized membrane protein (DUF373 family)